MGESSAASVYEAAFVADWDAEVGIGHVVVRRRGSGEVVATRLVHDEAEADRLLAQYADDLGSLTVPAFESAWEVVPPVPAGGTALRAGDPRVRVLPEPGEVFVEDQPWLGRALHPVVALDLSALDPAWSGWLPVVSPVEPLEGYLGDETLPHHDARAGTNWISFELVGDRLRFLGRRTYFEIEGADDARADHAGLREWYVQAERDYAAGRVRWAREGELTWGDEDDPTRVRPGWGRPEAVVDQFGGTPGWGNWTSEPPPAAYACDDAGEEPVLRLADGRPFRFVAATAGYPWRDRGADAIVVFFEPETRTVLVTFDWS